MVGVLKRDALIPFDVWLFPNGPPTGSDGKGWVVSPQADIEAVTKLFGDLPIRTAPAPLVSRWYTVIILHGSVAVSILLCVGWAYLMLFSILKNEGV